MDTFLKDRQGWLIKNLKLFVFIYIATIALCILASNIIGLEGSYLISIGIHSCAIFLWLKAYTDGYKKSLELFNHLKFKFSDIYMNLLITFCIYISILALGAVISYLEYLYTGKPFDPDLNFFAIFAPILCESSYIQGSKFAFKKIEAFCSAKLNEAESYSLNPIA